MGDQTILKMVNGDHLFELKSGYTVRIQASEFGIGAALYKDSEGDDSPPVRDFNLNYGDSPVVDPLIEVQRQKRLVDIYFDAVDICEDTDYWRGRADGLDQLERFIMCGEIQPLED